MPTSIMQKNYSHCPLKKRPVFIREEEEEEIKNDSDTDLEPENLSTKPEDLSMKKRKARSESPVAVVIKAEDTLPTPPPSSSPDPTEAKSPISVPTPIYGSHPSIYYPVARSPTSPAEPLHGFYKSAPNVYSGYPHFPYAMPYPSDIYNLYHHHISPPRSEPLSPYGPRDSSVSPPHPGHYSRQESISPPTMVPAYPATELRLNQNNNIIKSESFIGQHRYMPYSLSHHHHPLMMAHAEHPSLSPTSSHTSFNSYLSSNRSLSPARSSPSAASEENNNSSSAPSSILTEKFSSNLNIQKLKGEKSGEKPNGSSSGAPRYQCQDCSKSYSTFSGLSKHQQFHCPKAEGNQAQKIFVCKECDKPYKTLGALKMHIRTHTLPCKCNLCDKAFSRPWLLQGHIRTHTGEKPFKCKICLRAFADRSNLRAHQQTHEDVKRFKCPSCTKSFSRLPLLTKHNETGCPGIQLGSHPDSDSSPSHSHEDKLIPTVVPHGNITVY
ncbi:protein escargot-like [Toxorhynchites rutilus septentrionalis]|uniref:protein escargot-like n=1 Tax=Toxorhynchites rutilus septentrionalis TaxID=329112 RepID=UPI00247A5DEE|nr:protein escargot-like [Toxorhynchites rutilus septentrionalis]